MFHFTLTNLVHIKYSVHHHQIFLPVQWPSIIWCLHPPIHLFTHHCCDVPELIFTDSRWVLAIFFGLPKIIENLDEEKILTGTFVFLTTLSHFLSDKEQIQTVKLPKWMYQKCFLGEATWQAVCSEISTHDKGVNGWASWASHSVQCSEWNRLNLSLY